MTTNAATQPTKHSRLEPEPIPRRDVLGLLASGSALFAALFALIGAMRLPRAAVVPVASRKFKVTLPATLLDGQAFVPAGRAVAVFRDAGGVHAISLVCTHLGCVVKSENDGFRCPCHGSRFTPVGAVAKGPAPKALAWLEVTRVADGVYLVDQAKTVASGTKVSA